MANLGTVGVHADSSPAKTPDASTATGSEDRELEAARAARWRLAGENHALKETVAVLRAGANALAIDVAILRVEHARIRSARPRTPRTTDPR